MHRRRNRARAAVVSLALAVPLVAGCASELDSSAPEPSSAAASTSAHDGSSTDDGSSAAAAATPGSSDAGSGATQPPSQSPAPAVQPGAYISLADYQADKARYDASSTVVLFFHADWCHYCRETDDDIATHGVPDALTLVQVDYDSEDALRERYGVTVQHTYVQIDADGEPVARFAGQTSGAEILAETR